MFSEQLGHLGQGVHCGEERVSGGLPTRHTPPHQEFLGTRGAWLWDTYKLVDKNPCSQMGRPTLASVTRPSSRAAPRPPHCTGRCLGSPPKSATCRSLSPFAPKATTGGQATGRGGQGHPEMGDRDRAGGRDVEWRTRTGWGPRGERAPGFPAELNRLSRGGLRTAQSPSTKKRWPKGWQSHCMARGTEPPCDRQTRRALLRKKRCG